MLARVLLSALAALALVAGTSAQPTQPILNPGLCAPTDTQNYCGEVETTSQTMETIRLNFFYNQNGKICSIQSGSLQTRGVNSIQVTIPNQLPTAGSYVDVATLNGGFQATNINVGFVTGPSSASPTGSGTLGTQSVSQNALISGYGAAATVRVTNSNPTLSVTEQVNYVTEFQDDQCTAAAIGDPLFRGFLGQQFIVSGTPNGVINLLSAANFQVNTRLAQLEKGDSISEQEQKQIREASANKLPHTRFMDEAGTYMSELGVALLNDHQLYAKAGSYESGWSTVTVDGQELAVGATVTFGEGKDAVMLTRPSTHMVHLETRYLALGFVNSDKFFNVDEANLRHTRDSRNLVLGGALGKTANPQFKTSFDKKWQQQLEQEVAATHLFELSSQ